MKRSLRTVLIVLFVALLNIHCGRRTDTAYQAPGLPPAGPTPTPTVPPPVPPMPPPVMPSVPVTGSYCTVIVDYALTPPELSLRCLQADGVTWQKVGGTIDSSAQCGPDKIATYYSPHVSRTSDGDILVGYTRCGGFPEYSLVVMRYNLATGWTPQGVVPVNSIGTSKLLSPYSQFGGTYTEFQNHIYAFWTTTANAYFSLLGADGIWTHTTWSSTQGLIRHPEIYRTSTKLYLHYGEPAPGVWDVTTGTPVSMGTVAVSPNEYTLYSSLTSWNGDLVMAYTSNDYPLNQNWFVQTDVVKIAFHNSADNSWQISPATVQDTPGHDNATPFLFVISNQLYILTVDYTTDGLPPNPENYYARFRVKVWDGVTWTQVGTESDIFMLSQRLEYLLDGDQVLFSAMKPNVAGTGADQVVVTWKNGVFGQLGGVIHSKEDYWSARPGAVIRLQ